MIVGAIKIGILSVNLTILAGAPAAISESRVHLICGKSHQRVAEDILPALCNILTENLKRSAPGFRVSTEDFFNGEWPVVRLVLDRLDSNVISGWLEWRPAGVAHFNRGPRIETVIADSKLNERALNEFARGLVQASKMKLEE